MKTKILISFVLAVCLAGGLASAIAEDEAAYRSDVKITTLLNTGTDSAGKKIVYPAEKNAEVTAVLVELPPGAETGWHSHPVPCFGYIQQGTVEVQLASGEIKTYKAGEAFAEVVGLLHNGKNPGPEVTKIVMFAMSTSGQPFAVKK